MIRKTLAVGALALATATGSLVAANGGEHKEKRPCPGGYENRPGIGCSKKKAGGTLEVRFEDGSTTEVHGVDPAEPLESEGTLMSEAGERKPLCAGDYRFRVLYGYPSGSSNRLDAVRADLQKYARQMNARFNREAVETGAPSGDMRFDCDAAGEAAVYAFAFGTDHTYSGIVSSARSAGVTLDTRKHIIFADVQSPGTYSGVGTFYSDDRATQDNANNTNPGYGVTYSGFWAGNTPHHEAGHNLGAVQFSAPDGSGAGHCDGYGGDDVLCYNDGGSKWDSGHACAVSDPRPHFDACHNDYFDYTPTGYLADHWNTANSRWVSYGATPPPTTTTTSSTTTTTTTPVRTCFRFFGRVFCY